MLSRTRCLAVAVLVTAASAVGVVVPAADRTGIGAVSVAAATGGGAVVRTDAGPVRGTVHEDYRTFQGIPFAAPPVGERRWRSPERPRPWTETRDATTPGNRCAQTADGGTPSETEDCLYLNVTTPRTPGRKPVMVWIHGGGNSFGAGSDFDTHRLAVGGDVVVVTTNFRLGVFSSFAHPTLVGAGGFALEDQQAALRWVRGNAAAFGGDPSRVTLFGESGGGFDVCGQLASPGSRGLYHRAIIQSGTCSSSWPVNGVIHGEPAGTPWQPLAKARDNGTALAEKFGCHDPATAVACLRAKPAADLVAEKFITMLTPVAYGTRVLPTSPDQALAQGRFHRMPVITGNTRDEGRLAPAFAPEITEEVYQELLRQEFGDRADEVAARYPSSAHGSPVLAYSAVLTDRVWACAHLTDDRLLAARTRVYGYEFADRQAPTGWFEFPDYLPAGAFHSAELAYLFDIPGFQADFTPTQQRLADQMIRYWSRFAATGNPNRGDLPAWAPFQGSDVQSLAPADGGGIHPVNLAREHNCGFWAR